MYNLSQVQKIAEFLKQHPGKNLMQDKLQKRLLQSIPKTIRKSEIMKDFPAIELLFLRLSLKLAQIRIVLSRKNHIFAARINLVQEFTGMILKN